MSEELTRFGRTLTDVVAMALYCVGEGISAEQNKAHLDYWFGTDPDAIAGVKGYRDMAEVAIRIVRNHLPTPAPVAEVTGDLDKLIVNLEIAEGALKSAVKAIASGDKVIGELVAALQAIKSQMRSPPEVVGLATAALRNAGGEA